MNSQVQYLPMTPGLFSILVILLAALVILILVRILRYAYMRLGLGPGAALLLLLGSLIGSYFNIPITALPGETVSSIEIIDFFGMDYVVPMVEHRPGTVIAMNIGGAVIPTLMSAYLVIRSPSGSVGAGDHGHRRDHVLDRHAGEASASPCRFSCRWSLRRSWPSSCPAKTPRH